MKLNILKEKYFVRCKYLLFSLTLARLISALNFKTFVVVVEAYLYIPEVKILEAACLQLV